MQRFCVNFCRSFQKAAANISSRESSVTPGAKATLYNILKDTPEPLNSEQLWQQAEEAGLKSKRHVKFMLQTMRKAGALQTKPAGKGKNYVYVLRTPSQKASNKRPPQVDTSTEATAARILG